MRQIFRLLVCCCLLTAFFAARADAQYRKYSVTQPTVGETYHIEVSGDLWNPSPAVTVSSESLGIIGDTIDGVNDLGFTKTRFKELKVVLRPAKKHKLRFDYIPIDYSAGTTLNRTIVFNGQKYNASLPVNSELNWKAYHFGYEYDFLYRDRWFVGFVVEAKYTDVNVTLQNPLNNEYASVKAPIPALGGIVRVYPVPYVSITGELNGFKLPTSVDKANRYDGKYLDFNLYGTVNINRYVGAQVGYRSVDVMYRVKADTGNFTLKGLYFGAVARF